MRHWAVIALLEVVRLASLVFAFGLAPTPQSNTNEAIVFADALPVAVAGLIAYLVLTSWIGSRAPRYGLISTALQGAGIAFGIYSLLNYWLVLR